MIKRGDIYYADLSPVVGSEQGGMRPVLILQNNTGNKYSPTVIAAAITTKHDDDYMSTHVDIGYVDSMVPHSVVLLEQIRTIDKQRLTDKLTHLNDEVMGRVNEALKISLALSEKHKYI